MIAEGAALDEEGSAPAPPIKWPLLERLVESLAAGHYSEQTCRELLARSQAELQQRFGDQEPIEALGQARASCIDRLLAALWPARLEPALAGRLTLAAVGGYGRAE